MRGLGGKSLQRRTRSFHLRACRRLGAHGPLNLQRERGDAPVFRRGQGEIEDGLPVLEIDFGALYARAGSCRGDEILNLHLSGRLGRGIGQN